MYIFLFENTMTIVNDFLAIRRDRCYSAGPGTVQTERNQTSLTDSTTYTKTQKEMQWAGRMRLCIYASPPKAELSPLCPNPA